MTLSNGKQATALLHEKGLENILPMSLDVASTSSVDTFAAELEAAFGANCIDVLVNNAGFAFPGPMQFEYAKKNGTPIEPNPPFAEQAERWVGQLRWREKCLT